MPEAMHPYEPANKMFLQGRLCMMVAWGVLGHWCQKSIYTFPVGFTCRYKSIGLLHGPSLQMGAKVVSEWGFTNVNP